MSGPGLPNRQKNQRQLSLWQRFWSSPWMWLILGFFLLGLANDAATTAGRVIFSVEGIIALLYFFHYGDRRWGKSP